MSFFSTSNLNTLLLGGSQKPTAMKKWSQQDMCKSRLIVQLQEESASHAQTEYHPQHTQSSHTKILSKSAAPIRCLLNCLRTCWLRKYVKLFHVASLPFTLFTQRLSLGSVMIDTVTFAVCHFDLLLLLPVIMCGDPKRWRPWNLFVLVLGY